MKLCGVITGDFWCCPKSGLEPDLLSLGSTTSAEWNLHTTTLDLQSTEPGLDRRGWLETRFPPLHSHWVLSQRLVDQYRPKGAKIVPNGVEPGNLAVLTKATFPRLKGHRLRARYFLGTLWYRKKYQREVQETLKRVKVH